MPALQFYDESYIAKEPILNRIVVWSI